MEVEYKPSFIKNFNKIKSRKDQEEIYRIRKGGYRIGFKYEGERIVFMRVLKRSDIYKNFP